MLSYIFQIFMWHNTMIRIESVLSKVDFLSENIIHKNK